MAVIAVAVQLETVALIPLKLTVPDVPRLAPAMTIWVPGTALLIVAPPVLRKPLIAGDGGGGGGGAPEPVIVKEGPVAVWPAAVAVNGAVVG